MPVHEIKVEPLGLEDVPAACALEQAAGLSSFGIEGLTKRMHDPHQVLLGAFAQANAPKARPQLVGVFSGWVIGDEAEIDNLTVALSHRRLGVGKKLLTEALANIWQKGGRRVFLEVRASNLAAIHLYRSFGFTEAGRRPGYYDDPREDALVLQLELGDGAFAQAQSGVTEP